MTWRWPVLGLLLGACAGPALSRIDPIVLSDHGCGRATAYDNANKIVSWGDKTHVTWLDSADGKFWVRIKTLDNRSGTWSETFTVGEAYDNHGGPALTVDSRGHLHIVYYPHHHPVRYRSSTRPNDASDWSEVESVGARATYPTLVCGNDDCLYMAVRESVRRGAWRCDLYRRLPGLAWTGPHTILRARGRGYCQFGQHLAIDSAGTLHMSFWIYEDRDASRLKTTIGYLRSETSGESWTRANGAAVRLPADSTSIEVLATHGPQDGIVRGGAMALDPLGRPHVFYRSMRDWPGDLLGARIDRDGTIHRYGIERNRTGRWARRQVPEGVSAAFDAAGRLCLGVMTLSVDHPDPGRSWGAPGHEVAWATSADGGRSFTVEPVSGLDPHVARWIPSVERVVGGNPVERPAMLYTDGGRGGTLKDMLRNRVVFLRR